MIPYRGFVMGEACVDVAVGCHDGVRAAVLTRRLQCRVARHVHGPAWECTYQAGLLAQAVRRVPYCGVVVARLLRWRGPAPCPPVAWAR